MKKLLVVALTVIALVACGKKEEAKPAEAKSNEKKVVTVWCWDENFNVSIMKKAETKYEAAHPDVDIQVVNYAQADIITKMNAMLNSGSTNGMPEVILMEDYSAKKNMAAYPGAFTNLSSVVDYSQFAQYKVNAMTDETGTYGIPFDSGVSGFFYRKDLMEKAGITDADLKDITWNKYIEIGKKVKAKTGIDVISHDLLGEASLMRIMMQSAGKWYFDESGKVDIANNDALKAAMKVLVDLKKNNTMKVVSGWGDWVGSFNKGEAATVISGMWIMPSIKAAADQSGKWALTSIPKLDGISTSVNASNLGGSSWYVLDKSVNKDAGIEFLKTMYAGDNDFYQQILVENGAMGTYIPSQSGEAYGKADDFFGGQKVYEDFATWMKQIPKVNYGSYVNEADAVTLNALKLVLDGTASIDEALKNADAELKAQIGQ